MKHKINYEKSLKLVLGDLECFLLDKNKKYGNSLFNDIGIFHKGSPLDKFDARIDDKLARKKNNNVNEDEDIELDLLGYLINKRIYLNHNQQTITNNQLLSEDSIQIIAS